MNRKFRLLVFVILLLGNSMYGQKAVLSGHLNLDSTWTRKMYISRIQDFNEMYRASDNLIIARGDIDSTGNFSVAFPVSGSEGLYRLHIVRKNDPVSSLIIGSEDENHAFFIAGNTDHIYYRSAAGAKKIDQSAIAGGKVNDALGALLYLINYSNSNRDSLKNQLISTARNSVSGLVGLLAVHSLFALNDLQKKEVREILDRYRKDDPYGSRIFDEYRARDNSILIYLFAGVLVLATGIILYKAFRKRKVTRITQSLSQRESNIVRLIIDGRTNKEIASELNIELSTVKSHVNNIYTKLQVSSRKDLLRYKDIFSGK